MYLRTRYAFGLKAGGSVTHTSGVINAVAKNHDIDVYTNDYLPEVKTDVKTIEPTRISFLPTAINEILYNWKVIRRLKKVAQYDAIYHRLSANSFCGAFLAKKNNIDFILEYNASEAWGLKHWNKQVSWTSPKGFIMNLYKYGFEVPFATWVERYTLRIARKVVVVSDELKRLLVEQKVDPTKIIVYPNGVDTEKFRPGISGIEIRQKYGLGQDLVFGFIGSFGQWHGVEVLAVAINRFYENNPDNTRVKFLLIGDGLRMPEVKETLRDHIAVGKVVLPGLVPQEEAPKYLAACDVLTSPHISNPDGTKFFGSPTKLFEYMAMGKPIIASDLEQLGNILEHNKDALLTTPGDAQSLASTIETMAVRWSEQDYNVLGQNARKKVLDKYTWDAHVSTFVP